MIEKTISLEGISLVDFLGAENANINTISKLFPSTKIFLRGTDLSIQGNLPDISKVNKTFEALILNFKKYNIINEDIILDVVNNKNSNVKNTKEIILYGNKGILIQAKTSQQNKIVKAIKDNDMVFAVGPAGTGKTFLSVALAIQSFKSKETNKIVITRPAVEAGEHLGFLPGDMKEKVDPYLRPIYDALDMLIPSDKLKYYLEKGTIEIAPLAFLRGRTLNKAFILLDEAQNTTSTQMKMFLTRMGIKSKMIINGDLSQIDLPHAGASGLKEAINKLHLIDGIEVIMLKGCDVLRHKIVKKIINAYQNE